MAKTIAEILAEVSQLVEADELHNQMREALWYWYHNGHTNPENTAFILSNMRHTLPGGALQDLHPGAVTVHRGINANQHANHDSHPRLQSWTHDAATARQFAGPGGRCEKRCIHAHVPAIDIPKALGAEYQEWVKSNPELDEHEVLVHVPAARQ